MRCTLPWTFSCNFVFEAGTFRARRSAAGAARWASDWTCSPSPGKLLAGIAAASIAVTADVFSGLSDAEVRAALCQAVKGLTAISP